MRSNVLRFCSTPGEGFTCGDATAALLDHCEAHFAGAAACLPLYLQFAPHSVTVVGIRKPAGGGGRTLVVLDPATKRRRADGARHASFWGEEFLRKRGHYEVLEVGGGRIEEGEREQAKTSAFVLT
ncbi:hypothetical protein TeGR_g9920 [Tetraparma gracilis]|uniref:Uncharacterized protein n=1 Tax=Tetraparma gracilis TaxID=2962635 RepID=A0ABQ6N0F4_9STRA|nr:hypothetical protein TeGR_g9920 [Tetraparma gracilis]